MSETLEVFLRDFQYRDGTCDYLCSSCFSIITENVVMGSLLLAEGECRRGKDRLEPTDGGCGVILD